MLCKFMTKAEGKTLERLLSQNSLQEMKENRNELFEEFPVLNRKWQPYYFLKAQVEILALFIFIVYSPYYLIIKN